MSKICAVSLVFRARPGDVLSHSFVLLLHMAAFCRRFVYLLRLVRFAFDIAFIFTTFTMIFRFATSSRRRLPNDPG